jgi:hypothetical protein
MHFTFRPRAVDISKRERGIGDIGQCDRRAQEIDGLLRLSRIGVVVVISSHDPRVLESSIYTTIWHENQLSRVG